MATLSFVSFESRPTWSNVAENGGRKCEARYSSRLYERIILTPKF